MSTITQRKPPQRKAEVSLVRSSAAEYLTFVATCGQGGVEAIYGDESIWLPRTASHGWAHRLPIMLTLCHLVAGRDVEVTMKNPWTKKNPFMSMWLSGANAAMGSARGLAAAETKRQANALTAESTKQIVKFWTGAMTAPATPAKRKKKRA